MPLSMPNEGRLPPGPLRDLTQAIHVLYVFAGKPGTRKISDAIKERDDLPDTVSHEAVRNILLGNHVGWPKVQCVILQLARWAVNNPDPVAETRKFHQLWMEVEERLAQGPARSSISQDKWISRNAVSSNSNMTHISVQGEGVPADRVEDRGVTRSPLISWRTKTGTLDVYDRQMAIQLIKDIGLSDD